MPNPNLIVSEISAFIRIADRRLHGQTDNRTDGHTERRTWIDRDGWTDSASDHDQEYIYFILPSTCYIPSDESTILFTVRVTGIDSEIMKFSSRKNDIVECLDYQIPISYPYSAKGTKGDGDMQAARREWRLQAAKRDCNAPPSVTRRVKAYASTRRVKGYTRNRQEEAFLTP